MIRRREASLLVVIITLGVVLAAITPGYFARENLSDLFLGNMPVLIVAIGTTLVILTGNIDISVGSVFAICGVVAGLVAKATGSVVVAALAAFAAGGALGAVNGSLVAYLRMPSIVVTLASMVAMMAGADFIKTSTGKESVNATLPVGLSMVRAIRAYFEHTGYLIGFKPAGGISTAKVSLDWLVLMKEELGRPWLEPELFRFGASSLLTDIERQLEHHLTGRYSANHRHAMA